jgi:hypothetical protein
MEDREAELRMTLDVITTGGFNLLPQGLHAEAAAIMGESKRWVRHRNVIGFGIGGKTTLGHPSADICLKVYVRRKLPASQLEPSERVPESVKVPSLSSDVETDLEEIGGLQPELFTGRLRPLVPGYSIGHFQVNTGTLGCVVHKRGEPTRLMLLSNCHVLANYGMASIGDPSLQPGLDDGGTPQDRVAKLAAFTSFTFGEGYDNLCDAAATELLAGVGVNQLIPKIGKPSGVRDEIVRGLQVQKTGRTTEHTIGIVRDVDFRFSHEYPNPTLNGALSQLGFRNQVLCSRYTDQGDSGAAVCDMDGRVVGLHFMGGPTASVFSLIRFVLDALDVELVTGN